MSKKNIFSGLAAAIVILIIGSGFYLKLAQKNKTTPTETPTQEEETINLSSDEEALLYKEQDDVFYTIPNESETQLVDEEISIPSGTEVRTSNGIAVVVFLDDSIMTIDENTTVIVNYDDKSVSILQSIGNTWHRVTSLISSNNSYEVNTPSALATVRGTIFGVMVGADGESDVMVDESLVDVSQHTGHGLEFIGQLQARQALLVTQREMRPDMIRQFEPGDLDLDWLKRNKRLDNKWLKLKERELPPRDMLKKFRDNGELRALRTLAGDRLNPELLQREDSFNPDRPPLQHICEPACQEGFFCKLDTASCEPIERQQTWCEPTCQEGFFCDTSDFSCQERPPRTCQPNCDQGFTCNTSTFTCESDTPPQTTCEPACDQGFTCNTSNFDCEQTACVPACTVGFFCNTSTLKCEVVNTSGGSTPTQTTCEPSCNSGYVCNTSTFDCDPINGYCNSKSDCDLEEICNLNNYCEIGPSTCTSSLECGNGFACNDGVCLPPPASCSVDSDCRPEEICDVNICISNPYYCDSDIDCNSSEYCDETHSCTYAGMSCTSSEVCTLGETCQDGYCAEDPNYCISGEDCSYGLMCDYEINSCVDDPSICSPECGIDEYCDDNICVMAF